MATAARAFQAVLSAKRSPGPQEHAKKRTAEKRGPPPSAPVAPCRWRRRISNLGARTGPCGMTGCSLRDSRQHRWRARADTGQAVSLIGAEAAIVTPPPLRAHLNSTPAIVVRAWSVRGENKISDFNAFEQRISSRSSGADAMVVQPCQPQAQCVRIANCAFARRRLDVAAGRERPTTSLRDWQRRQTQIAGPLQRRRLSDAPSCLEGDVLHATLFRSDFRTLPLLARASPLATSTGREAFGASLIRSAEGTSCSGARARASSTRDASIHPAG